MNFSIVIPTYQEVDNLKKLLPEIHSVMEGTDPSYEILVVDDDSNDGSKELIDQLAKEGIPVAIHVRKNQRGLGSAVVLGMKRAQGEILLCMDGDFSHHPKEIPQLLAPFSKDHPPEMVIGSRYVKKGRVQGKWGIHRWINSFVATLFAQILLRLKIKDPMSGFFALPRSVFARSSQLNPLGYKVGLEILIKCACHPIQEVPICFQDRLEGESKLNNRERLNYLKHLFHLHRFRFSR